MERSETTDPLKLAAEALMRDASKETALDFDLSRSFIQAVENDLRGKDNPPNGFSAHDIADTAYEYLQTIFGDNTAITNLLDNSTIAFQFKCMFAVEAEQLGYPTSIIS